MIADRRGKRFALFERLLLLPASDNDNDDGGE